MVDGSKPKCASLCSHQPPQDHPHRVILARDFISNAVETMVYNEEGETVTKKEKIREKI